MRPFKRNITRRIGEHVVTVGPYGLALRRFGRRSGRQVAWKELLAMLGVDMPANRAEAFERPVSPAWTPKGGDPVYLSPDKTGLARGVVVSTVPGSPEPSFLVRVARGNVKLFERCDLRPAPPAKPRTNVSAAELLPLVE